jgi:hypothetical protein
VEGSCERSNEHSGSIKSWKFLRKLAASQEGLSYVDLLRPHVIRTENNISLRMKKLRRENEHGTCGKEED